MADKLELFLLDHLVGVGVSDFQSAGHIPGHMNHGNNGLDLLHLIPLKSLQGYLILVTCRYTWINFEE